MRLTGGVHIILQSSVLFRELRDHSRWRAAAILAWTVLASLLIVQVLATHYATDGLPLSKQFANSFVVGRVVVIGLLAIFGMQALRVAERALYRTRRRAR